MAIKTMSYNTGDGTWSEGWHQLTIEKAEYGDWNGKEFLDVFEKHQHTSSVGPTGGILPAFAMKALKSMSAKVFLG